ncbi:MAG: thioredoxin domain-containing protein [Balneolaceae bacterium]|nr:thioredoxin domain-containing protein [Balneolaceae bacterium]
MSLKNVLSEASSPYLRQHANNPVHWQPWGEEAFRLAKKLNRPFFLSIGYSTCHWCHVMERESFEDLEVASLLNEYFVSIKVDREERPDLDSVYMTACQILNGHGGWPCTLFLTHDLEPFFAGTYIPKLSRGPKRPGLMDLLPALHQEWVQNPKEVASVAGEVRHRVQQFHQHPSEKTFVEGLDDECANAFVDAYDPIYGGFGQAPKFPTPQNLMFLMDYGEQKKVKASHKMVKKTLKAMRCGGMFDHVGFGFHRYSTDRNWKVPHFEKMLNDQAFLLLAYSKAHAHYGTGLFERTAYELIQFVHRELRTSDGLSYTAIDADSEGEEGRFYTWTHTEIRHRLSMKTSSVIEEIYHLRPEGNYLEEHTGYPNGTNILYMDDVPNEHAEVLGFKKKKLRALLEEVRQTLYEIRSKRPHPSIDTKRMTDWNAQWVYALSEAGRWLDDEALITSAEETFTTLAHHAIAKERVSPSTKNSSKPSSTSYVRFVHTLPDVNPSGRAGISDLAESTPSFATDALSMCLAACSLFETTFRAEYLEKALTWFDHTMEVFGDPIHGGLTLASQDQPPTLTHTKEWMDTATPSLNSLFGWMAFRCWRLTGVTRYRDLFDQALDIAHPMGAEYPNAAPWLMRAHTLESTHPVEIILAGPKDHPVLFQMMDIARKFRAKEPTILVIHEDNIETIQSLCPFTQSLTLTDDVQAMVCQHHQCTVPVGEASEFNDLCQKIYEAKD